MDDKNDRSPCFKCSRHLLGLNKNDCVMKCKRLEAYRAGEHWTQIEPYEDKNSEKEVKTAMEDLKKDREKEESPENESESLCVICHKRKILNKLSKTCQVCYQRWRKGTTVHPTLGKFTPPQTHRKKSKTQNPKLKTHKPLPAEIPTPTGIISLDLNKYPEIKKILVGCTEKYFLPVEHIILSMLAANIVTDIEEKTGR